MMKKNLTGRIKINDFERFVRENKYVNHRLQFSSISIKGEPGHYLIHAVYYDDNFPPVNILDGSSFTGVLINSPFITLWSEGYRDFRIMNAVAKRRIEKII